MVVKQIVVLGFAGSLRKGSYNKALLRAAAELMPKNAYFWNCFTREVGGKASTGKLKLEKIRKRGPKH
ncbi:MAG: hypothetical protein QW161_05500 [Candidatus Bathyarchaeia archaeon]